MKTSELKRILKKGGCYKIREAETMKSGTVLKPVSNSPLTGMTEKKLQPEQQTEFLRMQG